MRWNGLDQEARELLATASSSVLIVAPFIKEAPLAGLLEVVPSGVKVEVFTRWRADEVASGVSDTAILSLVIAVGGTLNLVDELHAKLIAADLSRALVGSANVTAAGLGTSAKPNLELMHRIENHQSHIALFAAELRSRARPASDAERESVESAAAALKEKLVSVRPPDAQDSANGTEAGSWLPRFRSPDRLYHLYADPDWIAAAEPTDSALLDLLQLQLAGGLNRAQFDQAVQEALLSSAGVRLIDELLSEPQRFGVISAALSSLLPDATHADRQIAAQTLIRWLLHFAPDRYRVDTPNYSEILSRR